MELTLFILVGAVAVVAAVMMLISENAVHSALFLILNFACIAFFFLMLNASFLAMVQITVYAGAIMVLFLFVIMMLGAERLAPDERARFPWMVPAAIALSLVFLVTVALAIIQGEIDLNEPLVEQPFVRAVNALDRTGDIDVYLDDAIVAEDVRFGEASEFAAWDRGRYDVRVFAAGADPAADEPLLAQEVDLNRGEALSLTAVGTQTEPTLAVAEEDLSGVEAADSLRVTVVNGLRTTEMIDVVRGTSATEGDVLIDDVPFGGASAPTVIDGGTFDLSVFSEGARRDRVMTFEDEELEPENSQLWVFTSEYQSDNSFRNVFLRPETHSLPAFGSPADVGRTLFSRYVLPFEMVALVLLVAMMGAIIMTRELLAPRRQTVRRLANPPAELQRPITPESASSTSVEG